MPKTKAKPLLPAKIWHESSQSSTYERLFEVGRRHSELRDVRISGYSFRPGVIIHEASRVRITIHVEPLEEQCQARAEVVDPTSGKWRLIATIPSQLLKVTASAASTDPSAFDADVDALLTEAAIVLGR